MPDDIVVIDYLDQLSQQVDAISMERVALTYREWRELRDLPFRQGLVSIQPMLNESQIRDLRRWRAVGPIGEPGVAGGPGTAQHMLGPLEDGSYSLLEQEFFSRT